MNTALKQDSDARAKISAPSRLKAPQQRRIVRRHHGNCPVQRLNIHFVPAFVFTRQNHRQARKRCAKPVTCTNDVAYALALQNHGFGIINNLAARTRNNLIDPPVMRGDGKRATQAQLQ